MKIKEARCLIIRKNSEYLVGRIIFSTDLRWSTSPYDAWKTKSIKKAERVARGTGGIVMIWNPIVRKMRVL